MKGCNVHKYGSTRLNRIADEAEHFADFLLPLLIVLLFGAFALAIVVGVVAGIVYALQALL